MHHRTEREKVLATRRVHTSRLLAIAPSLFLLAAASSCVASSPFHARNSDHASRASQGYLGINFRDVADEQVATLKLKEARGEEVILVDHDGPACKAGLKEHDVLLQINGQPIDGEEPLRRALREIPPGKWVTFVVSREGQPQTITLQLANRDTVGQEAWDRHMTVPEPSGQSGTVGRGFFGGKALTTADLPKHTVLGSTILGASYTGALLELMGPQLADFFGAQSGLLVRAVDPSSPAGVAGMRAGDVVIKINSQPVVSSADWVKTVHENRGRAVSIVVLRDKKEQILTMTPDTKKRSSLAAPSPSVGMLTLPETLE